MPSCSTTVSIVESGKPQDLLKSGALFSALFGEEVAVA